jgi:HK97 family phage prohead protease
MQILDQKFVVSGLDEAGTFTGIASDVGMNRNRWSYSSDAFNASLADHKARGTMPALLVHHDITKPVGRWNEITPSSAGLRVRGSLALDTTDGREAYAHLKAGSLAGLSTGALHSDQRPGKDGAVVTKADLYEISLVAVPALPTARVLRVSSITGVRDLEDLLRDTGISGRKAKAAATAAWRAINTTDEPDAALASILDAASTSLARFHRS